MNSTTSNASHTSTVIILEDAYRRGEVAAPNSATPLPTDSEEPVVTMMSASLSNKKLKQIEDHLIIAESKKTKLKVFGVTKSLSFPKEFDKIGLNHSNPKKISLFY